MHVRVNAVGIHQPTGMVYADVSISDGGRQVVHNDFLIDMDSVVTVPRTDPAGRYLTVSGKAVIPYEEINGDWLPRTEDPTDPWQRITTPADQVTRLVDEITAYVRRNPQPGDHRSVPASEVAATGMSPQLAALAGTVVTIG